MIVRRLAATRGHTTISWLDSWHSFSFGGYHDPAFGKFGALRVINEDRVAPGAGFGEHGHADMEILSYVVSGALGHRDSLGNGATIAAGDIQRMTAGTGVRHAEMNASSTETVHFFQIWLEPAQLGLAPGYEQVTLPQPVPGGLTRLAGRDRSDTGVVIHQDATLYRAIPGTGMPISLPLAPDRRAWLQVVRGDIRANDVCLTAGDGATVTGEAMLHLAGDGEALIIDLA